MCLPRPNALRNSQHALLCRYERDAHHCTVFGVPAAPHFMTVPADRGPNSGNATQMTEALIQAMQHRGQRHLSCYLPTAFFPAQLLTLPFTPPSYGLIASSTIASILTATQSLSAACDTRMSNNVSNKQTKTKVWLRQGSKVETTKHTGVKNPFPNLSDQENKMVS
jgi:hypothetical protein